MDAGAAPDPGGSAPSRPGHPVVLAAIASYGERGVPLTAHAAGSALRQAGAFRLIVTVVDDGSGPSIGRALRDAVPDGASIVLLDENRGYAAACNVAIRLARRAGADYVWLLNNDIDMAPLTLASLVETLERRTEWAAVAPATIDPHPPFGVLGAGMTVGRTRARVRHLFSGQAQASLPAVPYVVEGVEGAAPLLRMAAIDAVGELDERYGMYWEDTDWSVRSRTAGWCLGVDPRARVSHLVAQSTPSERRAELMIANRVKLADKFGTRRQRLLFRAYFLLGWLPLYTVARLVPRYGVRAGARMSGRLLRLALRWTTLDEPLP